MPREASAASRRAGHSSRTPQILTLICLLAAACLQPAGAQQLVDELAQALARNNAGQLELQLHRSSGRIAPAEGAERFERLLAESGRLRAQVAGLPLRQRNRIAQLEQRYSAQLRQEVLARERQIREELAQQERAAAAKRRQLIIAGIVVLVVGAIVLRSRLRLRKLVRARGEAQAAVDARDEQLRAIQEEARRTVATVVENMQKVRSRSADDLRDSSIAFRVINELIPAAATAEWDDPLWESPPAATADDDLPCALRVGRVRDQEGAALHPDAALDTPYLVPLIVTNGAIILVTDANSSHRARTLMRSLVLRIALSVPRASFTLLDPQGLGAAFPMRGDLPKVRTTAQRPSEELNAVVAEIRRINQDVLRDGVSFHQLEEKRRRSETFDFVFVVDFPHAYESDLGAIEALVRIANSGPRAGRYLILERRVDKPLKHGADKIEFQNVTELDLREKHSHGFPLELDEPPRGERQRALLSALKAAPRSVDAAADWKELVVPARLWTERSVRRIASPLGHEPLALLFGEDDAGQECSHGVLAGQTGSGKSNLLHVLITGLAARYSPDELRLVLVDGKYGVTFEAYRELPHADVVSLHTSPELARSVLYDFFDEMERRYAIFQRAGVQNLKDYRERNLEARLPRMLLVVDEYQQLVKGDNGEGSQMLLKVAEQGRAAGMHMLLGSQQFQPERVPAALFSHMHLRIAMQLSPDYVQGLALFQSQGKSLIRDLEQKGLVVVNRASGKDGSNVRGAVAHLPEPLLEASVARIVAQAGGKGSRPVVLDGDIVEVLAGNPHVRRWGAGPPAVQELERIARLDERGGGFGDAAFAWAERPVPLWLGRKFDVHGHASLSLRRRADNHAVFVGADVARRSALLANALVALTTMFRPDDIEIDVIDGVHDGLPGAGYLAAAVAHLADRGFRASCAGPTGAAATVTAVAQALSRRQGAAVGEPSRLFVCSAPENLADLQVPLDQFAVPDGTAGEVRKLVKGGSVAGVHLLVAAGTVDQLDRIVFTRRELRFFSHRLCQQLSEADSVRLLESPVGARIREKTGHDAAALYVDMAAGSRAGTLFKSYAMDAKDAYAAGPDALRASFARTFASAGEKR